MLCETQLKKVKFWKNQAGRDHSGLEHYIQPCKNIVQKDINKFNITRIFRFFIRGWFSAVSATETAFELFYDLAMRCFPPPYIALYSNSLGTDAPNQIVLSQVSISIQLGNMRYCPFHVMSGWKRAQNNIYISIMIDHKFVDLILNSITVRAPL